MSDVKIWFDPMRPRAISLRLLHARANLEGSLSEWYHRGTICELFEPLPANEREALLRKINAQLPPDYLELMVSSEGAKLKRGVVLGLSKLRKLVLPIQNYYIVAEIDDVGVLAVKEGHEKGLFLLSYDGAPPGICR